nr:helix-turn-helix domain-containing protein [Rubellimicrobium rubrum]
MPCPFVHLSLEERWQLARLREQKIAVDEIARVLGRHRSTIYRELRRNWWHDAEVPQADGTWPVTAQQLADGQRRSTCKLLRRPGLQAAVVERLKDGWSPEQIAGRLKVEPVSGHTIGFVTRRSRGSSPRPRPKARNSRATSRSADGCASRSGLASQEAPCFQRPRASITAPRRSTPARSSGTGKQT